MRGTDVVDATDADDETVLDDVAWRTDADGTDFFVHDGWRYELADDGYAYPTVEVGDSRSVEVGDSRSVEVGDSRSVEVEDPPPVELNEEPVLPAEDPAPQRAEARTIPLPTAPANATPRERWTASEETGTSTGTLLELSGLTSGYGALPVLHGVDLAVGHGQTAVLFGLNGAGKTTTAMNVCGSLKAWSGSIDFDGQDATRWTTKRCVEAGIVMVPEGRRVFPELTVERNLQVGGWRMRKDTDWIAAQRDTVLGHFPRLRERLGQLAGTLSGGEQQMLAIARGLMANPRLLIIDEASMGLAPVIVKDVFDIVRGINEAGVTVLLIEQNVGALDVADVGVVMAQGRIVRTLTGAELSDRGVVSELLMG